MKEFSYTIQDPIGLHARPAGLLVKEMKKFASKVVLSGNGKTAEGPRLIAIMGMGIKQNDVLRVTVEGADEETATAELERFLTENL